MEETENSALKVLMVKLTRKNIKGATPVKVPVGRVIRKNTRNTILLTDLIVRDVKYIGDTSRLIALGRRRKR
jgi:hypothetical protein